MRGQDTEKLWTTITGADYKWVVAAMSIGLVSHILRALRWNQLLAATGKAPSTLHTFCAVMVGYLVNYAIPRAGEVSRCAILKKSDDIDLEKSVGSVVAERVFDVLVMLLLLGMAFVFQYDLINSLYHTLKKDGGCWGKLNANAGYTWVYDRLRCYSVAVAQAHCAISLISQDKETVLGFLARA